MISGASQADIGVLVSYNMLMCFSFYCSIAWKPINYALCLSVVGDFCSKRWIWNRIWKRWADTWTCSTSKNIGCVKAYRCGEQDGWSNCELGEREVFTLPFAFLILATVDFHIFFRSPLYWYTLMQVRWNRTKNGTISEILWLQHKERYAMNCKPCRLFMV